MRYGLERIGRIHHGSTVTTTLKRSRWPLPSVAALTAIGALVVALYQALSN